MSMQKNQPFSSRFGAGGWPALTRGSFYRFFAVGYRFFEGVGGAVDLIRSDR
jgi:hypothetical protein